MGQVLVIGAIGLAGYGLLRLAWSILKTLKFVSTHPIRDNPRLRIVQGIKTGREYVLEMAQLATDEATKAALRAERARHDSISASKQEAKTRRHEQKAMRKAEEARRRENALLANVNAQRLHNNSGLAMELAAAQEAREQAEEQARVAQQTSWDVASQARAAQEAAQNTAREAAEMARAAERAREEAEERLKKGIQPVVIPTEKEIADAKTNVKYESGLFHFAVAGAAGSGKSSLINAIRGLENRHADAAGTGVIETTHSIGRYPDPNPKYPFVWYDIPGAGTLQQPDWLYFNTQGLFIFDCVVVLFDNRFSQIDIAILANCRRFQIPTYIVRSKADVHIRNIMYDDGYNSDHDDMVRREAMYSAARHRLVADTRETVRRNLEAADLPDQRVYIVSNRTLTTIVKDQSLSYKIIDELELIKDMIEAACARRCDPLQEM
ncbi:interferon-inducible GTPase-domain-containing protein [Scleroderma yunnanense]